MNATTTLKITNYELRDVFRAKGIIGYALFYLVITEALIRFSGGPKAMLSLTNVILIVVPLVCLLFGTIYLYNARNFIEMLLVHPVGRGEMFLGLYLGLSLPLVIGLAAGVSIPFMLHQGQWLGHGQALGMLLVSGALLSFIYTAIAFLIVAYQDDRVRGLSVAFLVWFFTSVLYDGLVLFAVHGLQDYPMEVPSLVMALLNPTDLGRILLMLQFDISAMMGYTGAVFEMFFGSVVGMVLIIASLCVWWVVPLWVAGRRFLSKDL